jgi:hypothetical protein
VALARIGGSKKKGGLRSGKIGEAVIENKSIDMYFSKGLKIYYST